MTQIYHVYIVKCTDGSYYIGHTKNLDDRIRRHNSGRAAKHTSLRKPVKLVYSEIQDSIQSAMKRERQLKGWRRSKKEALIRGKT